MAPASDPRRTAWTAFAAGALVMLVVALVVGGWLGARGLTDSAVRGAMAMVVRAPQLPIPPVPPNAPRLPDAPTPLPK